MECRVTEDEQAIRKVVETWVRASQSGDVATVLRS
jgi:ketosteroid isomerase-like protein